MSTSFGQWYEEKKAQESGDSSSSSWLPASASDVLPLFDNAELPTFSGMKASLEAQLPQKVMGMDYQQRFQMFCVMLFLSALFFALGFFVGIPTIALRPQKFALCFTMGSVMFMVAFAILRGPYDHLRGMLSTERLPFTTIYVGSILSTLYFTFQFGGVSGYVFVLASAGLQILALLWYLISFLPGGSAGLSLVLRAMARILQPVLLLCARVHATVMGYCFSYLLSSSSSSSSSSPNSSRHEL